MKRYQCHKIVEAGLISSTNAVRSQVVLTNGEIIKVAPEFFARLGQGEGYLVQYSDGYQSWSPKQAFEEGYSEITDG